LPTKKNREEINRGPICRLLRVSFLDMNYEHTRLNGFKSSTPSKPE